MTDTKTKAVIATDITDRVLSLNLDELLVKAMRKIEPGNQPGNTSNCWKLDWHTRFTAARMHIIDHKSAAEINAELKDRMDDIGVTRKSLSGWLKTMRESYGGVYEAQLGEVENANAFAFQSGDLVALMALTISKVAPKYIAWFNSQPMDGMSNQDMHVMLRFIETQTTAAKTQAEARQREAQTQNILLKVRDAIKSVKDDKRDSSEAIKEIGNLIHSMMGIGVNGQEVAA